ncbi:MAG: mucoidy inhibitor MuiA family protein [Alphaproteobacteria bacterium]|nr:mucoidy inhibitor MuiA family protein [Alphaproteobacteria bacterium]
MRLPASAAIPVFSLSLLCQAAAAAEIPATSKIDAVTVYRSGAQVSRLVRQEIDAGSHTLVIKDLPAQAILGSIRVEGKADGDLRIGAVDTKRVSVLSEEAQARDDERKELEEELERLSDAMDQLRAEIETREAQKSLITNLTSLPQQPAPAGGGTANHDWARILDLIGRSMADIHGGIMQSRIAMRELGEKIEDVKKRLSALAPKQEQRTEVRVSVEAGGDVNADLIIKYQVGNASWRAQYDARLDTGSAEKPAALLLTRRATIQQVTGEAWHDVALSLSTSQPSGQSSAPELMPLTVDFKRPAPVPYASAARSRSSQELRQAAPEALRDEATQKIGGGLMSSAPAQAVVETSGHLERMAFQASFGVPGRVTVENTGEAKRVKLDDQKVSPKLNVRTVPRRDTNAYLYANIEMPNSAPYLAGPVSLFRDGSFVGMGQLPDLAPGADHELGFGSDPSVVVKYHILAEKRGETGIISSSSTDQRNFRIEIANQHGRPIDVVLIDQMPVSLNEKITVDLLGPTSPTERNYKEKRGLLAWEFPLKAAEKRTVTFGYTVAWPVDQDIDFDYRR